MVLYMYVGSLLPYIEGLDSWLFEGILDDPFDEVRAIEYLNYQGANKFFLSVVLKNVIEIAHIMLSNLEILSSSFHSVHKQLKSVFLPSRCILLSVIIDLS